MTLYARGAFIDKNAWNLGNIIASGRTEESVTMSDDGRIELQGQKRVHMLWHFCSLPISWIVHFIEYARGWPGRVPVHRSDFPVKLSTAMPTTRQAR